MYRGVCQILQRSAVEICDGTHLCYVDVQDKAQGSAAEKEKAAKRFAEISNGNLPLNGGKTLHGAHTKC